MKPEFSYPHHQSFSTPDAGAGLAAARITELLEKYDKPGPRYTSYPPATQFRPLSSDVYLEALSQSSTVSGVPQALSLYIHIPFCRSPCYYCGCNKIVTRNPSAVREYLDHLRKEMALLRLQSEIYRRPVTQLHWGGGTPTFLDDAEMTQLVRQTSHYFNLQRDEDRDYSIEIDPRTVNPERIELLRGLGFNRISLGIQDFDANVQRAINRVQSLQDVRALVEHIRARSFSSLNFDLIYGLPLQTLDTIRSTLHKVIALSPDRISYYNYAHLPERFVAQRAICTEDLPTPGMKLQILTMIIETLTAAGYLYIGMDHFVRPDDPLAKAKGQGTLYRNFQGYSVHKATDLIGLGVSSISNMGDVFAQNAVQLDRYYRALDTNQLPIEKGVVSNVEDGLRREIIQQLSCYRRLDVAGIERNFGINFEQHFVTVLPELQRFEHDGLIEWPQAKLLTVTQEGSLLLRAICMVFDEYLARNSQARPVFSRVI